MADNQLWTNEFRQSFRNAADLYAFLDLPLDRDIQLVAKTYPVFVPRKLAQKIKNAGNRGPLALQFLPSQQELEENINKNALPDPIGDKKYLKAPQLIHRYATRALFTPTNICPVHCRYCFRKNELNQIDEMFHQDFEQTLNYLRLHPEISELIFTGGDPLTLTNDKLETYLRSIAEIKSIKDIRFHSRYPVIMPERIDQGLMDLLKNLSQKFRTVSIGIHANHPDEFDGDNRLAIKKLNQTGVQLLSQTVLLRHVNTSGEALLTLMETFIDLKVRPYYLHHPDQVKGGIHFYIPLEEGRRLYSSLRTKLPGWGVPQYVIDIPEGHGKVPAYNPENAMFSGQLIDRDGQIVLIKEPDFFI